jgi:hypothetical protein
MRLLPSSENALIILLCHTLVHISYEIRPTLFEEISLISNQKGFAWNRFWGFAKITGIMSFLCFILSLYKKEIQDTIVILPKRYWYAHFMGKIMETKKYSGIPVLLKRLFFEIPFIKNPFWIIKNKIFQ